MYYWLESGGVWDPSVVISEIDWQDQSDHLSILPAEIRLTEGPDPHTATFIVKADPAFDESGWFPASATYDLSGARRPDGQTGTISHPSKIGLGSGVQDAFSPFEIVRIMTSTGPDDPVGAVRFVGLIVACTLQLSNEEWRVECVDIPRWYMTKAFHTGILYMGPNDEGDTFIPDALAVYNEDGRADQLVAASGGNEADTVYFTKPDINSSYGMPDPLWSFNYAGYWTLGSILNQLRELFFVNAADYGLPDFSELLIWPECDETQWPFLLEDGGQNQVVKNFALGGLSLSQCIDAIVRRAGNYGWGLVWNDGQQKWSLTIYSMATGDDVINYQTYSLSRGRAGDGASADPNIASGTITYDYSDCATECLVFGNKKRYETTIGKGDCPEGNPQEGYILSSDWTTTEQDNYQIYDKLGALDGDNKYDSVFQRFKIVNEADWGILMDIVAGTKKGPRQIGQDLLTEDTDAGGGEGLRKIKICAFRWIDQGDNMGFFEKNPESVSVQINQDMTVSIVGFDPLDETYTDNEGVKKFPRWLCKIPELNAPWTLRPFRITVMVEDDNRLVSVGEDVPTNWPRMQSSIDGVDATEEIRINALHGTIDGTPAENDFNGYDYMNSEAAVVLHSDQDMLDRMSSRAIYANSKPDLKGELELPNHNFDIAPGQILTTITGGTAGVNYEAIPAVTVYGHVRAVTFLGLAAEDGGQRRMIVELGST